MREGAKRKRAQPSPSHTRPSKGLVSRPSVPIETLRTPHSFSTSHFQYSPSHRTNQTSQCPSTGSCSLLAGRILSLSRTKPCSFARKACALSWIAPMAAIPVQGKYPIHGVHTLSLDHVRGYSPHLSPALTKMCYYYRGRQNTRALYSSKKGTLMLTNQRVVYLCAAPTAFFS